ncbi:MAG: hypothetical protein LBN38_04620 [Verrucomicrobiota bacterium]|jgi:hypothetical protein|nr:hypothetical protein [Verrucomicrobiota bacterium]
MSQWEQQISGHALFETLGRARSLLENTQLDASAVPLEQFAQFERIVIVNRDLEARLKETDPALISIASLNHINGSMTKLVAELQAYNHDKNPWRISNAHSNIENLLIYMASIPVPRTVDDVARIKSAVSHFRRSVGQYMHSFDEERRQIKEHYKSITQKATQLASTIEEEQEQVDSLLSEFRRKYDAELQTRNKATSQAEVERNSAFQSWVNDRQNEWKESIKEQKARLEKLDAEDKEQIANLTQKFNTKAGALLEEISTFREQAEKITGTITLSGFVGGFQMQANKHGRASMAWKIFASMCLISLVLFAVYAFRSSILHPDAITLELSLVRVFVAVSFGVLAAYAALQGERHERFERSDRKMELELAAIAPYLQDLPETERIKLKIELTQKLFGKMPENGLKTDRKTSGTALDLVKMALDALKALAEK